MAMHTDLPLVSIITPSFNQGQFIERTILSVLRQDYPNIEYIILDALSTDTTTAVLSKYHRRISHVVQQKDDGQSDALNKGFAMSSGEIMAYLNADDCFASPSVVSHAVKQIMSHSADVVYGRRYRITREGFFLDCYPYRAFNADSIRQFNIVPQECSFWTRAIYERAGNFVDTELRFSMDYELWLRFLTNGANFVAIDNVYGFFRWHENQKSQLIWREVCLPEVERIQDKYVGFATNTGAMETLHESFYFGVDEQQFPHQHHLSTMLWKNQVEAWQSCLADTPLDFWVYAVPKSWSSG